MKQHPAFARVVSFSGIAVVAAYFVHRGTIARIGATLMRGTLGRQKEKVRASVNGAGCG